MKSSLSVPKSSVLNSNHQEPLIKSKSVVFDTEGLEKEVYPLESPIKRMPSINKSANSLMKTPKQLRRSNSKGQFDDCENDFILSSGKNSRRKSSVMRSQLLRDHGDETSFYGSGNFHANNNRRSIFESNTKQASSALRCLKENEMDGISSNAPAKSNIRPTGARYL